MQVTELVAFNMVRSKYSGQEFQLGVIQYITSSSDSICPVQITILKVMKYLYCSQGIHSNPLVLLG